MPRGIALFLSVGRSEFVEALQELVRRLIADDPRHLVALVIEENDSGRAEQLEALEEELIVGAVRSYVRTQQIQLREPRLDPRIRERQALHFLAGHAPV